LNHLISEYDILHIIVLKKILFCKKTFWTELNLTELIQLPCIVLTQSKVICYYLPQVHISRNANWVTMIKH